MLNKYFKKTNIKKFTKSVFIADFYGKPEHQWILKERYIKANFDDFIDSLPLNVMEKLVKKNHTIFVPSNGKYGCAISDNQQNIIIIFPELFRLLQSTAAGEAFAILAHELGHVINGHSKRNIDTMEAQIEADTFAAEIGYADDLENFLLSMPESTEKRLRLSYLTTYILQNEL